MANKITKRDVINAMLAVKEISANEMFKEYLTHELELLDNKKANKKATKTQKENVGVKAEILKALEGVTEGITVTEVIARGNFAEGTSNQKISALLKQLKESGEVEKIEGKKSLFRLPTAKVETEVEGE